MRTNDTNFKVSTNLHSNLLSPNTEKLRNDLDEVEELTTRVRDSISLDLSNTRRYSPLLYEYYRKQIDLAKSIQCTYNIQCSTLFDAMTLMRKCLNDYCKTVHNPEYLTIDEIDHTNLNQYTYKDFMANNNPKLVSQFFCNMNLKTDQERNKYSSVNTDQSKKSYLKKTFEKCTTSTESTEISSSTSASSLPNDLKNTENTIKDNKQTYV